MSEYLIIEVTEWRAAHDHQVEGYSYDVNLAGQDAMAGGTVAQADALERIVESVRTAESIRRKRYGAYLVVPVEGPHPWEVCSQGACPHIPGCAHTHHTWMPSTMVLQGIERAITERAEVGPDTLAVAMLREG